MSTKKTPINLFDSFSYMKDKCSISNTLDNHIHNKFSTRNHIKGFVEIYENDIQNNKRLVDRQNLIVYVGREILAQVAVRKERVSGSGQNNLFISWLSVGKGGATAADPLTPLTPNITDTGLEDELIIDGSNSNYIDSGKKKGFDTIEFEQDSNNDDRYLITKITTTLLKDECNNNNINEAALWLCDSDNSATADETKLSLFSRVCFSTVYKDNTRELIFVWYLFF